MESLSLNEVVSIINSFMQLYLRMVKTLLFCKYMHKQEPNLIMKWNTLELLLATYVKKRK